MIAAAHLTVLYRDTDLSWQDRAACTETDPELWFPEKGQSSLRARRICWDCEVRDPCLQYAVRNAEAWGVWGGLSERQRRGMRGAA